MGRALRPPVFGRAAVLTALGAALVFAVGSAQAKPGGRDLNFGTRGLVTTAIGSDPRSDDVATGIALQVNGRIVVAGYTGIYPQLEIALARYNRAGSLDRSFGGDGKVTTAIGSSSSASAVAVQANGKIVAAGSAGVPPDSTFAVTRYNANGSPDTSFDGDGRVTTAVGSSASALDLVLQPDGKIVLAGIAQAGPKTDFALARYNADGSLDSSFGTAGTVTTPIGSHDDFATSLALQPDGKIVAAGVSDDGSTQNFALARYNADGSLDTTFGADGKVTTAIGSGEDHASALALQPDGKIVAAGWSDLGSNDDFALVRYNANGTLDSGFGGDGKVTTALGPNHDLSFALARQPDGKLVVGGFSESADAPDSFILVRYQVNGSLDSSFGAGGSVRTAFGTGGGSASAVAIQPDGKLVAAGSSAKRGHEDIALVRYLSGKERCLVPNVRRVTVPQAKRLLRRAYCSAGRVTRAFSSNVMRGRVISQTPKAGMRRAVWAKVALRVSKGTRTQR